MAKKRLNDLKIENARILFRNFSGRKTKGNPSGSKGFAVVLDPEVVPDLEKDGWPVKVLAARDEGGEDTYIMNVTVRYDNIEPQIYMVTKKKKTLLNDETVCNLDASEIQNVDLMITPYVWEVNGKSGVKPYVKIMYVTVIEDEFAEKYDFPELGDTPF